MSATLERKVLEIKGRATEDCNQADSEFCKVLPPGAELLEIMKARNEIRIAVKDVINALAQQYWVEACGAKPSVDPDSGDTSVLVYIIAKVEGREARLKLDEFLDKNLPVSAQEIEDELIFSVVRSIAA